MTITTGQPIPATVLLGLLFPSSCGLGTGEGDLVCFVPREASRKLL